MGFKSKVVGFVAVAALTFSMAGSVGAQESVPAGVYLGGNGCSLNITTTSINLGVWTWDGSEYKLNTGSTSTSSIQGTLDPGSPTDTCDVSVSTGGLVHEDENYTIDGSHLWLGGNQNVTLAGVYNSRTHIPGGMDSTSFTGFTLQLGTVPNTYAPGSYWGTIDFTISTNGGQP